MPELPEVETTRRGILPYVRGQRVTRVEVRQRQLRWPVSRQLQAGLCGQRINDVQRRGKYLLFETAAGTAILHLGMSGSLRLVTAGEAPGKHDHVDICLGNHKCLRFNDPRRFGSLHWTTRPAQHHRLLRALGPEPLQAGFGGEHLFQSSRGRRVAVKPFIMDSHVVVGVGNIYASESLFLAGIHPTRAAGRISLPRYERLADAIREVLDEALASGGATLNDFVQPDGRPGYFQHRFKVYGRAGEPCVQCGSPIRDITLGQRSTYYCGHCQR